MTVTFRDTYAGVTEMRLVAFRTRSGGLRVLRYRWEAVSGCVTTGRRNCYATPDHAIAAVRHDVRWQIAD